MSCRTFGVLHSRFRVQRDLCYFWSGGTDRCDAALLYLRWERRSCTEDNVPMQQHGMLLSIVKYVLFNVGFGRS